MSEHLWQDPRCLGGDTHSRATGVHLCVWYYSGGKCGSLAGPRLCVTLFQSPRRAPNCHRHQKIEDKCTNYLPHQRWQRSFVQQASFESFRGFFLLDIVFSSFLSYSDRNPLLNSSFRRRMEERWFLIGHVWVLSTVEQTTETEIEILS